MQAKPTLTTLLTKEAGNGKLYNMSLQINISGLMRGQRLLVSQQIAGDSWQKGRVTIYANKWYKIIVDYTDNLYIISYTSNWLE